MYIPCGIRRNSRRGPVLSAHAYDVPSIVPSLSVRERDIPSLMEVTRPTETSNCRGADAAGRSRPKKVRMTPMRRKVLEQCSLLSCVWEPSFPFSRARHALVWTHLAGFGPDHSFLHPSERSPGSTPSSAASRRPRASSSPSSRPAPSLGPLPATSASPSSSNPSAGLHGQIERNQHDVLRLHRLTSALCDRDSSPAGGGHTSGITVTSRSGCHGEAPPLTYRKIGNRRYTISKGGGMGGGASP